jgi:arylsulfatase A-like enzyme
MRWWLCSLCAWLGIAGLAAAAERPNIVMVFIDDLGWGDFSCFGNTAAQTPQLDRLAAEGLRFEQFYVNAPICSPSRCALTTGQYPARWGITSFLNNHADNERRGVRDWLDPAAMTLARVLHEAGYATGHFGKWHLGGQRDVDQAPAIAQYGFDESLTNFEGMGAKLLPLTMRPGDHEPGRIWADAERLGGPVVWMQRAEITAGFVNAAIPFMKRAVSAGQPFYVNLWPDDVHGPYWPPVETWGDGSKRRLYGSVLEEMDRQLGRLFEQVRSSPDMREQTLILVASDNGPDVGAGSAGPFRGTKATLYEGGVRSPLIVWGPGYVAAEQVGTTNTASVFAAFDLPPSLLSLAGITPTDWRPDGEDVSATLVGKSTNSRTAPLYWRRPPDRKYAYGVGPLPDLAMRDGAWKLLCDYDGGRPELYDLERDRGETNNLATTHPEVVSRLSQSLIEWHRELPPDRGPDLTDPPAAPKKSRATSMD